VADGASMTWAPGLPAMSVPVSPISAIRSPARPTATPVLAGAPVQSISAPGRMIRSIGSLLHRPSRCSWHRAGMDE
jgi:hypothetical protein